MKIDITKQPDPDIFSSRKTYILWFLFFMLWVGAAIVVAAFAVQDTIQIKNLENWAVGILVVASLGITWSGNRLQGYKRLFPPQIEKLGELRSAHPAIEMYCAGVEKTGRRMIRAEYQACVAYSQKPADVPFV